MKQQVLISVKINRNRKPWPSHFFLYHPWRHFHSKLGEHLLRSQHWNATFAPAQSRDVNKDAAYEKSSDLVADGTKSIKGSAAYFVGMDTRAPKASLYELDSPIVDDIPLTNADNAVLRMDIEQFRLRKEQQKWVWVVRLFFPSDWGFFVKFINLFF